MPAKSQDKPAVRPSSVLEQARKQGSGGGTNRPKKNRPRRGALSWSRHAPSRRPVARTVTRSRPRLRRNRRCLSWSRHGPGGGFVRKPKAHVRSLKNLCPGKNVPSQADLRKAKSLRTDELRAFYLKAVRPFLGLFRVTMLHCLDPIAAGPLSREDGGGSAVGVARGPGSTRALLRSTTQIASPGDHPPMVARLAVSAVPFSAALLVLFVAHVGVSLRGVSRGNGRWGGFREAGRSRARSTG
ncbi:MAG: hypothetical protein Ct9H300mP1_26070 [Planctomycetaceae bacterium]|nr:MAG: hypothetical protein Ct9H300mP1_26070 [Planctomycetaceae bacterium]